eukprot:TRINITY_DN37940_c0_g1_i1.p3 TRINITY_DN37940_c0_g1~~TRINITY_DN37940_c0_g1_i1.p3  ORF type:complete len:107 (-),score=2.21 TRINITY_DN37940_c0_g1_i1:27-347(-)
MCIRDRAYSLLSYLGAFFFIFISLLSSLMFLLFILLVFTIAVFLLLFLTSTEIFFFRHSHWFFAVSYTHLRAHETRHDLVCRLLLEKKKIIHYMLLLSLYYLYIIR